MNCTGSPQDEREEMVSKNGQSFIECSSVPFENVSLLSVQASSVSDRPGSTSFRTSSPSECSRMACRPQSSVNRRQRPEGLKKLAVLSTLQIS